MICNVISVYKAATYQKVAGIPTINSCSKYLKKGGFGKEKAGERRSLLSSPPWLVPPKKTQSIFEMEMLPFCYLVTQKKG